ncbi:hypothetical protein ASG40_11495 [Methylobacterium sp. Leaf399]|uniref:hypothetical protein n=1 Tax=Methylobacterium sp. Leaf399 TaxID=1736364 RepID=UPI000701E7C8|nr:hypothetical protein [Methylobacterium sp. Leaf399]KQT08498.1 hypothetical protein ASG40_11495 [Methylobacterium sp. Leaf399]
MSNRSEFIEAATAAAFKTEDGRTILHCFGGMCGADWDLADVIAEIEGADIVWWDGHFLDHDLRVATGRRRWSFNVKAPEGLA